MFNAVLYVQWKWARFPLLLLALVSFAVPVLSVRSQYDPTLPVADLLSRLQSWGLAYPMLAMGVGLILALVIWMPDRAGRHVYALSLPLPSWRFLLLRYAAGLVLSLIPVALLGLGALIGTAATHLPLVSTPTPEGSRCASCLPPWLPSHWRLPPRPGPHGRCESSSRSSVSSSCWSSR